MNKKAPKGEYSMSYSLHCVLNEINGLSKSILFIFTTISSLYYGTEILFSVIFDLPTDYNFMVIANPFKCGI